MNDSTKIQGFSRVQITEKGKVVGDSGLVGPNTIVNLGFLNFLVKLLGASAGSSQIGFIALGTGGTTATDATTIVGEITGTNTKTTRKVPTFSNEGSVTAQFAATFASTDSFLTTAANLSNIGLYAVSGAGTVFAGNVFASSSCNTNQNCNVTYQIQFS